MKRPETPQEKKATAYEKDHVIVAEYRGAHFKGYRRAKAFAMREERRKTRAILSASVRLGDDDMRGDLGSRPVRRKKITKQFARPVPLGEHVAERLRTRKKRVGWNFFHAPYRSSRHRESFVAFLGALIQGKSGDAVALAERFRGYLDPGPLPVNHIERYRWNFNRHMNRWFQAFFEDEPEWEPRLRDWVERLIGE